MDQALYQNRIEKVKAYMAKEGIDAFLLSPCANLKYVSNYGAMVDERLLVLVISQDAEPFFIANRLYKPHIDETPVSEVAYWDDSISGYDLLKAETEKRKIKTDTLAVDGSLPSLILFSIQEKFPQSKFVLGSKGITELRLIKDAEERKNLEKTSELADLSLKQTIEKGGWIGKTEKEFLNELINNMTKNGMISDGSGIAAVGENAASPHHTTGQTKIREGAALLVDFGATYNGYFSDMTRTFYFGKPSDKFVEIYNTVLKANLKAEREFQIGMLAKDLDKIARDVITEAGYGDYFIHRLGHGIGMDIHEAPGVGIGQETPLVPGMAFSVEPGIYLEGDLGVRIEDIVLVTEEGLKVLNHFPKELIIIEE